MNLNLKESLDKTRSIIELKDITLTKNQETEGKKINSEQCECHEGSTEKPEVSHYMRKTHQIISEMFKSGDSIHDTNPQLKQNLTTINQHPTKQKSGKPAFIVKECYEAKVAVEALNRAGRNKNLHGIAHEIIFKDKVNINPVNIIKGKRAFLTKSATAMRDDIVIKQSGKVVGRMQLKDTPKSISATIKQVSKGKYKGTRLVGTTETTNAYTIKVSSTSNVTQNMNSSGISSTTTKHIASKALGKIPSAKVLATQTAKAGLIGAAISGGIEVVSSLGKLNRGELNGKQFAGRVVKESANGGVSGAAASATGTVATAIAGTALASTTAPVWLPVVIGTSLALGAGAVTNMLFKKIFK